MPLAERKPDNEIRYAAFGSSSTWGAAIPDRDLAYVKVLSKENGDNYGFRSTGPNYPAACTKSMLGEEEYDVIIFEFFNVARSGLFELAQRLRERFPDAILVMLGGSPELYTCSDHSLMKEWHPPSYEKYGRFFCRDPEYKKETEEYFEENQCPTLYADKSEPFGGFYSYMKEISGMTDSYILNRNPSSMDSSEYVDYVKEATADDCFHYSVATHEKIANHIKALIDRVGVPKKPRVNPFSVSDHCINWFLTGDIDPSLRYSPSGTVGKMPHTEKYALTFEGEGDQWIEMTNESDQEMFLFVSHMSTGPAPTNVKYPKAAAFINGEKTADLDPVAVWPGLGGKDIHVTSLTRVGKVGPGETTRVYFKTFETTEWPLRIVQVLFTPKGNYGNSYLGNKEKHTAPML